MNGSNDPTMAGDPMDDPRVFAAVQEYISAVEAGKTPNRRELIARYPEIANELSDCLQGLAFVHSAAAEIGRADAPTAADAQPHPELEKAEPLGDFRLVREIGRGGMAVVYEATQLSLGRRVALKVLPMAGALDPRQLQRFRNEAQAAAQLHHTNIVPVYAVGYERSVHFYAMQYIEGQSLAEVIQELRKSPQRDAKSLSINGATADESERQRRRQSLGVGVGQTSLTPVPTQNLSAIMGGKKSSYYQAVARLAMQAADALEYAHQLGVVHRDIKPANLLLDVQGILWITDFGLAQLQTDTGLTQPGDMLGTLRYMSPEQASGEAVVLDQRTDVYSLGLTLYELLTLERAMTGETRNQLLYQIGNEDPKPARSIDRAIPVELETIIVKATAKDPADRYASAKALANDLRRFLQNEPILARPPSLRDKAIKWTRRHKGAAIFIMATLVLIVIASLTTTALVAREAAEVNRQSARADASLKRALEAVDYFTVAAEALPKDPQFLQYRQNLLEAALANYRSFVEERKDDPTIGPEVAAARTRAITLLEELRAVDQLFRLSFAKRLLGSDSVQDDLKLTDAQRDSADKLVDDQMYERRSTPTTAPFDLPLEQRQARIDESVKDVRKDLDELLTHAQFDRLMQIMRQRRGLASFNDTDVADALGYSREQKELIQKLRNEMGGPHGHRPGGGRPGGGPPPDGRGRGSPPPRDDDRDQKAEVDQVVATFTPAQAKTWTALRGKPFTGEIRFDDFGGGPPDGPPDGMRDRRGPGGPDGRGPGPGGPRRPPRWED